MKVWEQLSCCVFLLCFTYGCVSESRMYRANYAGYDYANRSAAYRSNSATQTMRVGTQTVVTPVYSFADPTVTGSEFQKSYGKTMERNQERNINEFLRSCGMWGGTVMDTRDRYKVSIGTADRQIALLRQKIVLAGRTPDSDAGYVSMKARRDAMSGKLQELDDRIMRAIVSKATGDAARRLVWPEQDRQAADAAAGNLMKASDHYEFRAQQLLNEPL